MSKNNKFAQQVAAGPQPSIASLLPPDQRPLAAYADLGTPSKLVSARPTLIPARGTAVDTFSTAPRAPRSMHDYGGFALRLHELGVVVTDTESGARVLVPWGQVLSLELE